MTAVLPHAADSDLLLQLAKTLRNSTDFEKAVAALAAGRPASIDGVWGSACALVAAALAAEAGAAEPPVPLVVVLPSEREADDTAADVELFTGQEPQFYPSWETAPDERLVHDETFGERLRVLKGLLAGRQDKSKAQAPAEGSKAQGPKSNFGDSPHSGTSGLSRFIKSRANAGNSTASELTAMQLGTAPSGDLGPWTLDL